LLYCSFKKKIEDDTIHLQAFAFLGPSGFFALPPFLVALAAFVVDLARFTGVGMVGVKASTGLGVLEGRDISARRGY
jgi:hypothetical protein